jgi:hypothetical protein
MQNKLKIITEEFFQVSLAGYLAFLAAETVSHGFISNFFNLNILLIVVLILGVIEVVNGR